jgi:hypothetical protein
MKYQTLTILAIAALLLAGCGKDDAATGTAGDNAAPSPTAGEESVMDKAAAPVAPVVEKAEAMADGAAHTIDHGKDEIEFRLKRSLAGMESLLEDIKDSEQVEMIKKEMADLQAKLDSL